MISEVFNMDCMEGMKNYPDKYFELAIVDPPYGINRAKTTGQQSGKMFGNAESKRGVYSSKNWDASHASREYFYHLVRISKNQIIWGANNFIERFPYNSPAWIVWDKENRSNDFGDCELAWTSFQKPIRKVAINWNGMWQYDMKNKEERIHPTQKPIKLYKWLLKNYANPGDKILDTHLGSGSSRIAAYSMGFDFTGYEIDKEYFDKQERRFNDFKMQLTIF